MHRSRLLAGGVLLFGTIAPAHAEATLSGAQQAVISSGIEKLQSPEERDLASGWDDAKQVAEFICRPLALDALQKWDKTADRVFLGTDDPGTLTLAGDTLLRGSGEVRTGSDWTSFEFTCALDPETGRALSLETDLQQK